MRLHAAVAPALEEDAKGNVSQAARKRIDEAIASFRAKFKKNAADFEPGYEDALGYFTTLASLTRLLNDPSMKTFLAKLENNEERTVGNLVAFMNSHNLRFGRPPRIDRLKSIPGLSRSSRRSVIGSKLRTILRQRPTKAEKV